MLKDQTSKKMVSPHPWRNIDTLLLLRFIFMNKKRCRRRAETSLLCRSSKEKSPCLDSFPFSSSFIKHIFCVSFMHTFSHLPSLPRNFSFHFKSSTVLKLTLGIRLLAASWREAFQTNVSLSSYTAESCRAFKWGTPEKLITRLKPSDENPQQLLFIKDSLFYGRLWKSLSGHFLSKHCFKSFIF